MIDEKKIEKAAIECADEYYSVDLGMDREEVNREIFTRGAHWAINSLWHPNGEEPEDGAGCIVERKDGFYHCWWDSTSKCFINRYCDVSEVKRWCNFEDILPKEGGEQ